jgi:serine/threonine protein kinase
LGRATGEAGFQRHVAIKQLREEHAQDDGCLEMFVNEARLAATLHHHNIVQVLDIDEEDGKPFFAMEYVHGVDLRTLLRHLGKRSEQLPVQHVVSIIASAAAALHHAHEQRGPDGAPLGIVHRQVTPANILVGFDGNVKIVDFGIAKAAIKRIQTGVGVLRGSAPYMAPEQCAGRTIDRRSDVFALGIVLYELSTVRRLFKGANEFLTMSAVVNAEVPRPSQFRRDVPGELEVVMLKALARDPLSRYQTAHDMATALDRVARQIGIGGSTTALANYLKLQFGERKEPWLDTSPEEDPETTVVDFDGSASGLAPPPSETLKSNAIPRDIAATKSSPIAQARTIVMTPARRKSASQVPVPAIDKSFSVTTDVDGPANRKVTTVGDEGEDDDEPPTDVNAADDDAKSTAAMPRHNGGKPLTSPPATVALKVNPLATTEVAPVARAPGAAVAVSAARQVMPTSTAPGASLRSTSPPATVALDLSASPAGLAPVGSLHAKTSVSSPPPPPDSAETPRVVKMTDATAIVEPLANLTSRAATEATEVSRKKLYIGAGLTALLGLFLAIVFWPTSDPVANSAAPVAEAPTEEEKPPEKSALDMTARDYEEARAASGSAKPEQAEPAKADEAAKAEAEKAEAAKAEAEKAEAEKAEAAEQAKAEAAERAAQDAAAKEAAAELAKADKADKADKKKQAEEETDTTAQDEAASKALAAKQAREEAEAKEAAAKAALAEAAKARALAAKAAKEEAAAKAAAAKSAKTTKKAKAATTTKRTTPTTTKRTTTTKKKTTTKKPKWDPDDLFLGE